MQAVVLTLNVDDDNRLNGVWSYSWFNYFLLKLDLENSFYNDFVNVANLHFDNIYKISYLNSKENLWKTNGMLYPYNIKYIQEIESTLN